MSPSEAVKTVLQEDTAVPTVYCNGNTSKLPESHTRAPFLLSWLLAFFANQAVDTTRDVTDQLQAVSPSENGE